MTAYSPRHRRPNPLSLTLHVWRTSPWFDLRIRGFGRRAGRLSYAFPVVLALSFAALWIAAVTR